MRRKCILARILKDESTGDTPLFRRATKKEIFVLKKDISDSMAAKHKNLEYDYGEQIRRILPVPNSIVKDEKSLELL